jgi:hypothetical protein
LTRFVDQNLGPPVVRPASAGPQDLTN